MSRLVSSSLALVSLLALWSLPVVAHAQGTLAEALGTYGEVPSSPASSSTSASSVSSATSTQAAVPAVRASVNDRGEIVNPVTGQAVSRAPELDVAVIVAVGGEGGVLRDGADNGRGLQAFGTFDLFLGHDVFLEGPLSVAIGYAGMVGYGSWNFLAAGSNEAVLMRHGVGVALRNEGFGIELSSGVSWAMDTATGYSTLGANVLAQFAFFAGPVWIGVPFGVDIWPDQGVYSVILGVNVGVTTL
ncbi:MAG: hypothetical protein U0353_07270 [Sandaracinus sp.]